MAASTPIWCTALDLSTDALIDLGVFGPEESIPNPDAQFALRVLNTLVSSLQLQPLAFPVVEREVFPVVANQGTYTIGPGGDFDTVRPMSLAGAGLLFPASGSTPAVEIPRAVGTDTDYADVRVKDLTSPLWTAVFYTPTYRTSAPGQLGGAGLGSIQLWPIPTTTTYSLVLYRDDPIRGFANLSTRYDLPPGYREMLQYQLEKRLAPSYGKQLSQDQRDLVNSTMAAVKRQNYEVPIATVDLGGGGGYDISIGE